ncbi:MAG: NAD-dependent epimerase/dehydratase family protein [Candidatus Latescibacteria bacterium]|nr:NAD-dependent epimerase/dehydratase family protein [Candidatus Latescibacterota bacterium]
MKILVTGAAGFIGSHLSERLVKLGHDVRGLDCLTDYYLRELKELNVASLRDSGVDIARLDLAKDDLTDATKGVDLVYHLAGQPGISANTPFDTYVRNNIQATHRLLDSIKRNKSLQGFVNIATSSVYGADASGDESCEPRPTSTYGVTKLAAEQLALSYAREGQLPACSLRLFSVYGPRERPEKLYPQLIRSVLEGEEFPLFEGSENHERSYTFVGDIVDGFVAVLENIDKCHGEIFNIGTDASITTGEGIRIIENITGKPARFFRKPKRPGDQWKTHANIEKARRLLDYRPSTVAEEGLAHEVAWYREKILGKITF